MNLQNIVFDPHSTTSVVRYRLKVYKTRCASLASKIQGREPSTRVKLNTNSSDTSACKTCYKTQRAPFYIKATCARSDIKSLSLNLLIARLKQPKPAVHSLSSSQQIRSVLENPPVFLAIKLFIVSLLRSWGLLKNDIPCYAR